MIRRRSLGSGLVAGLALLSGATGSTLAAQGFPGLVTSCAGGDPGLTERCHQVALALEGARGAFALAASGGSEVPGSASTLGSRLRRFPRLSFSGRIGVARGSIPAILSGYGVATNENSFSLPSVQLSGTAGVFDGFSLRPAAGGILALDLTASGTRFFPPDGDGLRGSEWGWGVGARLGILRESFNFPGVSLTVARRFLGDASLGDMAAGDPAEARFEPTVTSYRGMIGKDLFGVGIVAGGGWDRIKGDGAIGVRASPSGFETGASAGGLTSERTVLFGGASWTFLVLQLSGEVGWSEVRDSPLPAVPGGATDPSLGAWFASVALRLTF